MPDERLYDSMLFNYETTNRTDFQPGAIKAQPKTVYKEKPNRKRRGSPELKDIHTLMKWRNPKVPTELYMKPKEIIRTNPEKFESQSLQPVQKFEPSEEDRQRVRATRPRLVMTPAVSMDDIDNPEDRQLLVDDTYKSTVQRMQAEVQNSWRDHSYRAPLNGKLTCANPITIEKLQMPYVSPEWRMDSVSWDSRQLRAYADPCKAFYLSREPKLVVVSIFRKFLLGV